MPKTLPRTSTGRVPTRTTTDAIVLYWAERIEQTRPARESYESGSMIVESDSIYHYGHHFELARIMRDKRGRTRLVLLNGDSYGGTGGFGPSTSSRQADVRAAVAGTDAPSMTVPFSAMDSAGIDFDTVQLIDAREDRWTTEECSSTRRPADLTLMEDPNGRTRTVSRYDYAANEDREVEIPLYVKNPHRTQSFSSGHGWCRDGAWLGEDGRWHWQLRRHWLGDCTFRARLTERRTRKATAEELAEEKGWLAWQGEANRIEGYQHLLVRTSSTSRVRPRSSRKDYGAMFRHQLANEGIWEARQRHDMLRPPRPRTRNGRTPIRVTRWATFLSSFDYQEARPLYFLCELPYRCEAETVEEALEALKPPEVVAAEARGLKVTRQGDLFAIPTRLTKRQLRRMRGRRDFEKRLRVLGTNHSVTEGIVCKGGAVFGRGIMRHEPDFGRRPDHARQKLGDGKGWHLLVRNTVPRVRA